MLFRELVMNYKRFIKIPWVIAALGTLFVIVVGTHLPESVVVRQLNVTSFDKIVHVAAYSILGYMLLRAVSVRSKFVSLLIVLGLIAVIGALDEFTQPIVHRTASVTDWLADCGGVCIAGLYNICRNTSRNKTMKSKERKSCDKSKRPPLFTCEL